MNGIFKLFTAMAITLSLLGFYAPAALAAAPANDVISDATVVTLGFSETLDTTQATTDADDAQLNSSCGAPATDASVWYQIVGTDAGVVVDVSSSNYSAGVLVGVGTPGNLSTIACGPGSTAFFASAGTTYYILAIDDQGDGGGNGGTLNIGFHAVPPPPTVDITLNQYGKVNTRTGVATISGTYSCSNGNSIDAFIEASQQAGRFVVLGSGEFFDVGTCDGAPHNWTAAVYPQAGKFAGGKAMTVTFAFACGVFECSEGYTQQVVILQGKK